MLSLLLLLVVLLLLLLWVVHSTNLPLLASTLCEGERAKEAFFDFDKKFCLYCVEVGASLGLSRAIYATSIPDDASSRVKRLSNLIERKKRKSRGFFFQ